VFQKRVQAVHTWNSTGQQYCVEPVASAHRVGKWGKVKIELLHIFFIFIICLVSLFKLIKGTGCPTGKLAHHWGSPWLRGHKQLTENLDLRLWVWSSFHASNFSTQDSKKKSTGHSQSPFHARTAGPQSPPNFAQTSILTKGRFLTQAWPRQHDPPTSRYPKLQNLNR